MQLQMAAFRDAKEALRSAKKSAANAAAPAVVCDPDISIRRDTLTTSSLPHRQAKPTVEFQVTAIDPQDDDNEGHVGDPPIVDISTLYPPPSPRPSRSPDRKRIASSGSGSPPKRHGRFFPDGIPKLVLRPPRRGGRKEAKK